VAAPTAGLHFTPELFAALDARGVSRAFITLHVGPGTFKPLASADLTAHVMHQERFEIPEATAQAVTACRQRGGRVVAIGTTVVRALEWAYRPSATPLAGNHLEVQAEVVRLTPRLQSGPGSTRLFIYPPFEFHVVDALLTNFHLPHSTLLALVMAFGGVERIQRAYAHAVAQRFRFYSYGDAMVVLARPKAD